MARDRAEIAARLGLVLRELDIDQQHPSRISTARLTVVTCTPTLSAICCILSGSMYSGPRSKKERWC